jgi:alpha-amylase
MNRLLPGLRGMLIALYLLAACNGAASTPSFDQTPLTTLTKTAVSSPTPDESSTIVPVTPTQSATLIPYTSPDWFEDVVLYEIFVRSFYDSNGDGIGDFNGIAIKLDYLESLGINTIWLMPINPSPSVHGYDVSDYFDVNPDYGTFADFQALVEVVHEHGMRLIIDFVPSHLSNQHPLFQQAYKNPQAPNSDWFVWTNEAHSAYAGFAGNQEMPRFNHYNPEVVEYLSQVALFWLDLDDDGDYTDGVDGFRVDNATFPPQEFLISLRQVIKNANPEALLLGETWVHNPTDLSRFFQDQFDALFDFPLYELMQGNQDSIGDGILAGKGFPVLITSLFEEGVEKYPEEAIPVHFFSNHDTNRIATKLFGDPDRMRLTAAFMAALPDPIMIYYGAEIGMYGQKGGPPYWDNYRREPMDWFAAESGEGQTTWFVPEDGWNKADDGISVEEQDSDPDSLLNYYRNVIKLRHESAALSAGGFEILTLESSGTGTWGIFRSAEDEMLVALYNFSGEARDINIQDFPLAGDGLIDLLSRQSYPGVELGQPYSINLSPASAVWLTSE